jgi:uncharacterized protein (DUF983 family)
MPDKPLINQLPHPPPASQTPRGIAWRCSSCGLFKVLNEVVEKPSVCMGCGKDYLTPVDLRANPDDRVGPLLLERLTLFALLAQRDAG